MNKENTFITTVAFVGQPNVGKSTLLNALVGAKIAPTTRKPQTTRRIIRGIKTVGNCQQIYFDTPGVLLKRTGLDNFMHSQIAKASSDVEQIVVIVDAMAPVNKYAAFLLSLRDGAANNGQNFLLAINKIDEIRDKGKLLGLIAEYAKILPDVEIMPVSAINGDGLNELFNLLKNNAKPGDFIFNEEFFTDASEKEIVAELIREKAMLELKDEVPYKLAVTIENFDESRREDERKPLILIEAVLHVERKSQKAIVIGHNGDTIKTIGIRARKEIEQLLQCLVMLKLFVRVEPNWTTSPNGLRKLGF